MREPKDIPELITSIKQLASQLEVDVTRLFRRIGQVPNAYDGQAMCSATTGLAFTTTGTPTSTTGTTTGTPTSTTGTTTGTPTSTTGTQTTQPPAPCGSAVFTWRVGGLCGFVVYTWSSTVWLLTSNNCTNGGTTPPAPSTPGTFDGEQVAVDCECPTTTTPTSTTGTSPTTTQTTEACPYGKELWEVLEDENHVKSWNFMSHTCQATATAGQAGPPLSDPTLLPLHTQEYVCCLPPETTTTGTTTGTPTSTTGTTTGTTPPQDCGNSVVTWQWVGSGLGTAGFENGWSVSAGICPQGCASPAPPYPGSFIGEVVPVACLLM